MRGVGTYSKPQTLSTATYEARDQMTGAQPLVLLSSTVTSEKARRSVVMMYVLKTNSQIGKFNYTLPLSRLEMSRSALALQTRDTETYASLPHLSRFHAVPSRTRRRLMTAGPEGMGI